MAGRPIQDETIIAIARLHYEDRMAQNEIAAHLGISTSTVSRALKRAHEMGFVEIRVLPSAMRKFDVEEQLIRRFGLAAAVVVESRGTTEETHKILGGATALYIGSVISDGSVVGVSDGQTVAAVAAALRRTRHRSVNIIPLLGGVGIPQLSTHPTEVCRVMAMNLGGVAWNLPVPAVADTPDSAYILRESSSTKHVFNLMSRLDLALVGVGGTDHDAAIIRHGVVTVEEMDFAASRGAVGTICARFYDKEGTLIHSELDNRTLAITLDQLRRCPRRIAAANGREKVMAMRAGIMGGLINIVATDVETARMLLTE